MIIKLFNKLAMIALISMPLSIYAETACLLGQSCTLTSYDQSLIIPVTKQKGTFYNCKIIVGSGKLETLFESDKGFEFNEQKSSVLGRLTDANDVYPAPNQKTIAIKGAFDKTGKGNIKVSILDSFYNHPLPGDGPLAPLNEERESICVNVQETITCTSR